MKAAGQDILSDLGFSRAHRRKMQRAQAKRLGEFTFESREDLIQAGLAPEWCERALASGRYWLQEKAAPGGWIHAMVGRHDKKPWGTWAELQKVKNAVYGPERWALQCFPPEAELTNVAHVYWLFVAPEGWAPEWQGPTTQKD